MLKAGVFFETQAPTLYRFWTAWKRIAKSIGEFQGRLLLGIIYVLVVAPLAILLRLAGQDPLMQRTRRKSYWLSRPPEKALAESLQRQY